MIIAKLFITLLFFIPFLLATSVASADIKPHSLAQRRRYDYDPAPPLEHTYAIELAHAFLEVLVIQTDPELIRETKRSFLTEMEIIQEQKSKKNAKKTPTKSVEKNAELYYWVLFNYPTFQEALELSFSELSAQEAVAFARAHSRYFFQATPAVLSAIKDYSAFMVADVKMEAEHRIEGFLLDVESAVRTLPLDCLIQCLENASFELNPRQQVLIKSRVPELVYAARHDPRLVYQFVQLYDDKSELFTVKSLDEMVVESSAPVKSKKGKKVVGDYEEFKIESESPAKHLLYGNLINVAPIIARKTKISKESWTMLVFSYAVYTDTLIEQIFGAIWQSYPKFVGFREATFVKFHQMLIDDLVKISAERAKLLAACNDDNLKLLLSVPLSKPVRDALAAVNEETKDILITQPATPSTLQQWLWAQVKSPNKQVFPFQVKSATEIFQAFIQCFCVDRAFERFKGGHVVDIFTSNLLFGEQLSEWDELSMSVKTFFIAYANRYIENFGGIPGRFPEVNSPKFKMGRVYEMTHAFLTLPHSFRDVKPNSNYVSEVIRRNTLCQLIQYTVSSDVILEALKAAAEPTEIHGIVTYKQEYIYFYNVLQTLPELLGNHHWEYLIKHGFCPESFLANFTGNMIRHHGNAITLPKLDSLTRGLYAVPLEQVLQFMRDSKFMFDEPLRMMECIHVQVFSFHRSNPSVESIEFYNMMTPWLHFADAITLHRFELAESLIDFSAESRDINIFLKTVVSFLLRIELNYLQLRIADTNFNSGKSAENLILQFTVEKAQRSGLATFLNGLIEVEGDNYIKQILNFAHDCLVAGPLSPARLSFILVMAKKLEDALKDPSTPNDNIASIGRYLRACKKLLPDQAFNQEATMDSLVASTMDMIKMLIRFSPDNEYDYNELMYSLAILETGHETCKLTEEKISSALFRKAIAGDFKSKIGALCKLTCEKLHLDYTSGEFVTQDREAMLEEVKEFKRQQIRKNLQAAGVTLTKK